jgi:hypothetical protein
MVTLEETELVTDADVAVEVDGSMVETLEETELEMDEGGAPAADDGFVATLLVLIDETIMDGVVV